MTETRLVVGGLTPFSTIDYPGRLAAVVFCQGCPWRCSYCHNPQLQQSTGSGPSWPQLRDWLASRRALLDGVVFSGGEPLVQPGLPAALAEVRAMGFAVGLHTAGIYPRRLAATLPNLDWVGFDVKAPFDDYRVIAGIASGHAARRSLQLLLESGVAYELRCTLAPALDSAAIGRLAAELACLGAVRLVLQGCRDSDRPGTPIHRDQIDAARRYLDVVTRH